MPVAAKPGARTKPPETRRNDIMNAAQRLFVEHGVAATTVDHITAAAEVAKGTFYLYFTSKDELLAALGARFGEQLLDAIHKATRRIDGDWRDKLAAWAKAYATGYLASVRVHDAVFSGTWSHPHDGELNNCVVDDLERLLEEGKRSLAWSIDDTRMTAVFLFGGIHSMVDHLSRTKNRMTRASLARTVETLALRSVGFIG
ncbi:TetR/AcrR family transcriptional regulator [Trinickia diaoshuihuensis]|uniref:TetR/AcrR family transcriptional regulator n=1 Tax=Trinickia diaoshuihuensis TaxID=2292265 RepID=UPI000E279F39|nr:TetR/AcrR family transcriptional regulator [Trinickia diaoshuihuensis]